MNEMIKNWLRNLLDEEIRNEKGTIANERIWSLSDDIHAANVELHEEYIKVLENIKKEFC
jgi:hypothetical protein